ncbi:TPA: lytic transglycosylase domain-containing protein [Yersinia enterocolitica]|nr:lytic transglycosylase domain-containing protein [Yersinia enterocolitica]HEI6761438.1 lytic transglycosylase domain-containing protein [Yersinia enterocolitica]HEI6827345.1 lytic transglycosylase domain-containing protein [Yersinia enterocolitica]HEI6868341.1 lytic transglycosylase domain-containing protein [Yersinia enterocolitica]
MIIEELAYKVTVRTEEFLSGKKKVEEGAKSLGKNVSDALGEAETSTKGFGTEVKKVGDQVRRTADDTKRPFGFISGGFFGAAKGAKEFGKQGTEALGGVVAGTAKFLGLALSIEGTRRLFTSATNSLVDLGNASKFLDLDPKEVDGWKKGAESVGSSAEAITSALVKLKNTKNWSVSGMGAPDDSTQAILQLGSQVGVDIIGAKDPGEMFKKVEEALRKLPKEQAATYIQRLGYDTSLLPSILDGSLDQKQGKFQGSSNNNEQMIKQALEVKEVMVKLDQTTESLGNNLVKVFGPDAVALMETFNQWVTANGGNVIDFFKDADKWVRQFSAALAGNKNAIHEWAQVSDNFNLISGFDKPVVDLGGYLDKKLKGNSAWQWWKEVKDKNIGDLFSGDKPEANKDVDMEKLLDAVMKTESGGRPNIVHPVSGATGAYQFMTPAAKDMGLRVDSVVDERLDPAKSREAARKYLNLLLNRYGGDKKLALMAYNGGMGRIDNHLAGKGEPLKPETIEYPGKVLGYYEQMSQYASMSGMPSQSQSVDNSRSQATHINNVNVNSNPQSVDAIQKSIEDQLRRSIMTGTFISGNG